MKHQWLRQVMSLLALSLVLTATACDNNSPDAPPQPSAPTFQIASVVVPLVDGTQGLQFAATPSADVSIIRVDVRNPLGNQIVFSPQNTIVLQNQAFPLQSPNEAYIRVSGTWTFRFVGQLAAGTQQTFDVTTTLNVGALTADRTARR
ncbi:MAG: hypothetical protein ACK41D_00405 [Rubricoccaceae bacterium]